MSAKAAQGALGMALTFSLAGCFTGRAPQHAPPEPPRTPGPGAPTSAAAPDSIADAVPRIEPRSRYGNPPFYDVFGVRYYVLSSSADYVERGVASWYGPGFHKIRTSTGEPYDMYAMTAAHKTLPLPAYVRVTNLTNGRSVLVRVNDRGPFVGHRIIDLSYSAAAKLDMLRDGTAMVEVRSIDPAAPLAAPGSPLTARASSPAELGPRAATSSTSAAPATTPATATAPAATTSAAAATVITPLPPPLFIQAGAFADPGNAMRLADRLKGSGYGGVFVREDPIAGRTLYRVRIGPVANVPEYDRIVTSLEKAGVRDAHLALD
jgi:rare lipoprotein A